MKFQSTPSGGKATLATDGVMLVAKFQSTPSGGKATRRGLVVFDERGVSIHAFRGEGDAGKRCHNTAYKCFNPRLPGGRRLGYVVSYHIPLSVSIHAFRGEGDLPQLHVDQRAVAVSIHAFRGEGDFGFAVIPFPLDVSIHAFRGEGDQRTATETAAPQRFNPRLPGGRRLWKTLKELKLTDVSIHAFRGEGDIGGVSQHSIEIKVSIHAFRGEGDVRSAAAPIALQVSIHAFRGEGDATAPPDAARPRRFNPRLPGGRRQQSGAVTTRSINVSIHAFRGEGDAAFLYVQIDVVEFQSTPSGGKATGVSVRTNRRSGVSIHAFRGEGDSASGAIPA